MMQFEIEGDNLIKFLKETTDLFVKFSTDKSAASIANDDAFLDFCCDTIEEQSKEVHRIRIARTYYGDVDCYHALVMHYQGIYFVLPSPEHDPIGYFFKKDDAIAAADQFASEVYDDNAETQYRLMHNEPNQN